ncbi:MAG: GntR family transcriptional regulator [Protaetiibacter sp.]
MTSDVAAYFAEQLLTPPGQPLRVAVYTRISRGIRGGTLRPGTLLPRETELGAALGVSRTVVREALMLLEEDGLIVTRRGIGRFVADTIPHEEEDGFPPLEELFAGEGARVEVRRIELSRQGATDFVTDLIGIAPDAAMWFRECVITRDGQPVALVQEYLPGDEGLRAIDARLADEFAAAADDDATLLGSLTTRADIVFEAGPCQVAATLAGQTRARLLQVAVADPLLVLTQTARVGGEPAYISKCAIPASSGHLVTDRWSLTRVR